MKREQSNLRDANSHADKRLPRPPAYQHEFSLPQQAVSVPRLALVRATLQALWTESHIRNGVLSAHIDEELLSVVLEHCRISETDRKRTKEDTYTPSKISSRVRLALEIALACGIETWNFLLSWVVDPILLQLFPPRFNLIVLSSR